MFTSKDDNIDFASRKRRSETPIVSSPSLSNTSTSLRVRFKQIHGVAQWTWNASDEVCGICQTAFEGTAPGVKYPGEDCPVVWGQCGHAFHLQCVSKWLTSKNSCPICRQDWDFGQNPIGRVNPNNQSNR
jgi:anaphase-promoting complex subunit 11